MIHRIKQLIARVMNAPRRTQYKIIAALGVVFIGYAILFSAPAHFPEKDIITIEEGASLMQVASELKEQRVVRSSLGYTLFSIFFGGTRGVLAGDYYLEDRENLVAIAYRTTQGDYGLTPVAVTIPEGTASFEMIPLFEAKLAQFDAQRFMELAEPLEGRLFPDTYYFLPNTKEEAIVKHMHETFKKQVATLDDEINSFDRPFSEILVMASLLEKEARLLESRQTISGILWKRIEIGMPPQVDAVFGYIKGTEIFHPTHEDLEIESPYNTYKNRGLPPGPITNPGLEAILAAVTPIETNYLYYLTGRDGNMYYSEDFDGHIANRRRYLD